MAQAHPVLHPHPGRRDPRARWSDRSGQRAAHLDHRLSARPDGVEDVLEPELPIVDPHHHLWGPDRGYTPRSYLLPELAADVGSGHRIVSTVYVEAGAGYYPDGPERLRCVGETAFAASTAATSDVSAFDVSTRVAAGIVASADLSLGSLVSEVLEAHLAVADGRLRGIRDILSPHASADPYRDTEHKVLRPDFRAGLALLAEYDLTFDVLAFHFQLRDVLATVRAVPEVTFVLDHLGGVIGIGPWAGRRDEVFAAWRTDLAELAAEPNVVIKLGGMNMHMTGYAWHKNEQLPSSTELAEATAPWFDHAIQSFGPDRAMFESNFPPDKISGSYRTLWNSFKRLAAGYSPAERTALFSATATRVYRL